MIIDGSTITKGVLEELRVLIKGRDLGLAAVFIGDDPALKKFVDLKKKTAQDIGILFSSYELSSDAPQETVEETMRWLAKDEAMQGILVELPMPENLDTQKILDLIPSGKDVDVLTTAKEKEFYNNTSEILPPAVEALKIVFETHQINPKGKTAVVFGQGRLVGKPISHWLALKGAQVESVDIQTKKPELYSQKADIIITGVGKPDLITEDMIKEDAIVIDFGYGKKGGKMAGDVDYEKVSKKASLITPVPGGMGPLVIAAVLKNLVSLSK
jgi:methylenetetrahydrofolate dehydrogenase (NADP+)/methenyltetrahydrofolate cyclohydrolase